MFDVKLLQKHPIHVQLAYSAVAHDHPQHIALFESRLLYCLESRSIVYYWSKSHQSSLCARSMHLYDLFPT